MLLLLATHFSIGLIFQFATELRLGKYPVRGITIFQQYNKAAIENLMELQPVQNDSNIPSLHILVPKNTLDKMEKALLTG
ncbi:hypothetical protein ACFL54_09385, partial [Planctomycetota bacterium]